MKAIIVVSLATLTLCSGCIFDDDFWDDYDSTYDSPSGSDDHSGDCRITLEDAGLTPTQSLAPDHASHWHRTR